ncbi:potassium channel family protein [Kitasatospora cathayae]|uniref:Potassium channel family protein n=1 Tax=Kitasatospora cathayae TaxID=3004092 RepID=A0ABY7Q6D7_9ACTN|nr:potassium channel family protein [Kitasatospora sp. HUAS 3-15]WBP88117.1 potassium channel family protein [Kitasatospora sp. HUAS 3-15]
MSRNPSRIDPATSLWLLGACTALMLAYFTLPLRVLGPQRPVLSWLVFAGALVGLSALLLAKIMAVLEGRARRPVAWLAFLIFLAMTVFAASYYVLAGRPGDFEGLHTRLDALYFTVVTLATVGYGDITPAGQAPRLLVVLQIGYNFVFLAAAAGTMSRTIWAGAESRARRRP